MKEIHYLLGNTCNLSCDFCFWDIRVKDVPLSFKKRIINEIVKTGIKKVTVSGGEPTCTNNFLEILEYMFKNDLEVILHTNGLKINSRNYKEIVPFIKRISLALDGSNKNISLKMRGNSDFTEHTISLINLFHHSKIPVSVKTLITKINQKDILNIGKLLKDEPILYWSLLEFNPVNRGKLYKSKFSLEDSKFDSIVDEVTKKFPNMNIKIRKLKREPQKYCFISSQGKIYTYIPNKGDIEIGNLEKENLSKILLRIF